LLDVRKENIHIGGLDIAAQMRYFEWINNLDDHTFYKLTPMLGNIAFSSDIIKLITQDKLMDGEGISYGASGSLYEPVMIVLPGGLNILRTLQLVDELNNLKRVYICDTSMSSIPSWLYMYDNAHVIYNSKCVKRFNECVSIIQYNINGENIDSPICCCNHCFRTYMALRLSIGKDVTDVIWQLTSELIYDIREKVPLDNCNHLSSDHQSSSDSNDWPYSEDWSYSEGWSYSDD
jgi:hypothetical protein